MYIVLNFLILLIGINVCTALETENIIGGYMVQTEDFHYQVLLDLGDRFCGGVILNDYHVLSTAHCITRSRGQVFAIAGTYDAKTYPSTRKQIRASRAYIPRQFSSIMYTGYDISVLELEESLLINLENSGLRALELSPSVNYSNRIAIISGFGVNLRPPYGGPIKDGYFSEKLHYTYVNVHSNDFCVEQAIITRLYGLADSIMCGSVIQTSSDPLRSPDGTCVGDSGGPLVYNGNLLIGLLSFGNPECNELEKVAYYENISHYSSFINNVLEGNINRDRTYIIDLTDGERICMN